MWIERTATYILDHGRSFLLASGLMLALGLISATGLKWNENIMDLLPREDPVVSTFFDFIDRFDVMDYVYFEIGSSGNGRDLTEDELIGNADQLHQQLASSGYFEKIVYHWEPKDFYSAVQQITRHRASLFSRGDAALLEAKLTYDAVAEAMEDWKRVLTESPAPFLSKALYEDPLGINEIFINKLHTLQSLGAPLTMHEGRLFSEDRKHTLIVALPRFPATDSYHAEELIEFVDAAIERIEAGDPSRRVRIAYFGGHRASLENGRQIKADIKLTIMLSVAAIALLSFLVYSRPGLVLVTFVPVIFGAAFASGVIRWLDPFMSAIAIGCGSMLIGISVDYAIHILHSADQIASGSDVQGKMVQIVRRLFAPIVLSASTTLGAFCVLHFSIMPGFRNIGHFGALGIIGAAGFSIVVLPIIAAKLLQTSATGGGRYARPGRRPVWRLSRLFRPLFSLTSRSKAGLCLLLAALTVLSLVGAGKLEFEGDVQQLNSITPRTRHDLDRVVGVFGDIMSSTAFAIREKDLEQALQRNETLAMLLARAQKRGAIRTVNTVAGLLPSKATQRENRKRWESFWKTGRLDKLHRDLAQACAHLRMRPEAFEKFFQSLRSPLPLSGYGVEGGVDTPPFVTLGTGAGLLGELLANYMSTGEEDVILLTRVKLEDFDAFREIQREVEELLPGTAAFNGRFFVGHMAELIYGEMKRLGSVTLGLIFLILLIFVRRPGLLVAMLVPLLTSLLWTFGLMGWLDIRLNIMNSVVAVFIFGLIVDYSIFLTMAMHTSGGVDSQHLLRTCGAITISAGTTLCGMGALLFAGHPALHSIGATASVGIGSGLIAVFTIIPLLGRIIPGSSGSKAACEKGSSHSTPVPSAAKGGVPQPGGRICGAAMNRAPDPATICDQICGFLRTSVLDEHIDLTAESRLSDLGVDSVSLVALLLFIERRFGVMLPESALTRENLETVETLAHCVRRIERQTEGQR